MWSRQMLLVAGLLLLNAPDLVPRAVASEPAAYPWTEERRHALVVISVPTVGGKVSRGSGFIVRSATGT